MHIYDLRNEHESKRLAPSIKCFRSWLRTFTVRIINHTSQERLMLELLKLGFETEAAELSIKVKS